MSDDFLKNEEEFTLNRSPDKNDDDQLWDEIDRALEQDLSSDDEMVGFHLLDSAYDDMKQTMLDLSALHLAPVCRYMKALALGEESSEIFEISEMIVSAVIPKLEEAGLKDAMEDLVFFRSLLLLTMGERDQHALEKLKEILLESFQQLKTRFNLNFRGYRSAVRNLVEFYREMKHSSSLSRDDHRRLFSIGIPSLTWIRKTRSAELSSLSGIPLSKWREIKKLANLYQTLPSTLHNPPRGFRLDRRPQAKKIEETSINLIDTKNFDFYKTK